MLILFLLIAHSLAADNFTLKVDSAKFSYLVKIDKTKFEYAAGGRKVKYKIKSCSRPVFKIFTDKVKGKIDTDFTKFSSKTDHAISVNLNGEQAFFLPLSSAGILLSKVVTDVDYLISEAVYRCSKK